jgi:hypothetical protein
MKNPESITVTVGRREAPRRRLPLSGAALLLFVAGAGALLGSQIVNPAKRVIEGVAGVLLAYVIWNSPAVNALWILLVIYPFPFAIAIGHSTLVFVIVVFLVYLVRVSAKLATLRSDRQFNLPIALFIMSYAISYYNVATTNIALRFGLVHTGNVLGSILLFYMIINFVDTEERLEKTMRVMMIAAAAVIAFTILEMLFPGRVLIPGWLYTQHKARLVMTGIRVGGPFKDYELVAEFFAMNAPIIFFMMSRARRLLTKSIYALLFVADIAMLFSTITRGAFISLSIGLIYMAWTCRRDITFVRLATIASGFVVLILVIDFLVARYTITGSLLGRMLQTTFESGIVPENRVASWGGAIKRGLEHPIIGHGPGWDFSKGLGKELWPHSAYLFYFNITGIFGLLAFLFILWRLWRASSLTFGSSVLRSAYPDALLMILNVSLVIFVVDQIKIDYPRNDLYMYFIWIVFGLIAATRNLVIQRERARPLPGPSP